MKLLAKKVATEACLCKRPEGGNESQIDKFKMNYRFD